MKVARRADIAPFYAMEVLKAANQRAAEGGDVLHLEVGEPGAGTPRAATDKLYAAAVFALSQPEVKAQFTKLQSEISIETPEVAARKLAQQAKMFGDVAKNAGIQPQ